jgi:ComF family protein
MTGFLRTAFDGLLDLVYPPRCLVCETLGEPWLCPECVKKINPVPRPYCDRCGHPLIGPECTDCEGRERSFETARAAGEYSGVLREAIHHFKYGGHRMLAEPLAQILHKYLSHRSDFTWSKAQLIVPVPIHKVRKRIRGYNQSELLADELARLTGIPSRHDLMERRARTRPQVELSRDERRENLRGAFVVTSPDIIGKTILLIDDVSTTCSTVHECSAALKKAGAKRVYVLCLAFGS